jgi:4'-phosphopantetheinyl transferase
MISNINWSLIDAERDTIPSSIEDQGILLSPGEKKKWLSLRFEKRRNEWWLGRWTAKQLFRFSSPQHQILALDSFEVMNEPGGAPYYASVEGEKYPVNLSISHRGRKAFCALTFDSQLRIGADLECIEPYPDNFVETYFTRNEAERIRMCCPDHRDLWVVLTWSVKEALLKALGLGLRLDTRLFEVQNITSVEANNSDWGTVDVKLYTSESRYWRVWWKKQSDIILTLAAHWVEGEKEFILNHRCSNPTFS